MVLNLLLAFAAVAAFGVFWIWRRPSRCPQCGRRAVTRFDRSLLSPHFYCVMCRFEWVRVLTASRLWRMRRQHTQRPFNGRIGL
jgi:hypothetical protein